MKIRPRAFTLIELLVVIAIISVLAALLLPAPVQSQATRAPQKHGLGIRQRDDGNAIVHRNGHNRSTTPLGHSHDFRGDRVALPGLSVGTTDPQSIYTAELKSTFQAANPAGKGYCEVHLPLPPQIISLAGLEITVNSQPSTSVEVRGNQLVWFGVLPTESASMTVAYSAGQRSIPSPNATRRHSGYVPH